MSKQRAKKQAIGTAVQQLRKLESLSQTDLCEKTQISQPTISRIERGKSVPSMLHMSLIEDALCVEEGRLTRESNKLVDQVEKALDALLPPAEEEESDLSIWDRAYATADARGIQSLFHFAASITLKK